jgi:hypothetical protein
MSSGGVTFLGRPLRRGGCTISAAHEGSSDCIGSIAVDVVSSPTGVEWVVSGSTVLATKAISTRLASTAVRRFLAFSMPIARDWRSSSGRVSISRISWVQAEADSSGESFSGTGGVVGLPVRSGVWHDGAGTRGRLGEKSIMVQYGASPGPWWCRVARRDRPRLRSLPS